jgi:hypothetical protein
VRFLPSAATVGALVLGTGLPAVAQEPSSNAPQCPTGRVSFIFVDNHSVFDTSDEVTPTRPLRWAYGAANSVHVRTRQSFIERELLFDVGDCLDPFLLAESARILREYRFIASADLFSVPQPDGTHHVVVDTWDEWSTKINIGVAVSDGFELRRFDVTEENFLGRGMLIGAFFRERREQQEKGLEFESPRLFGSRWDGRVSVGRTRVGDFLVQELRYPFLGEIGQVAARQQVAFRETLFAYSTPQGDGYDNVLLPLTEERIELTAARRCCEAGSLTMFGLGLTYEGLTFPGFPDNVEVTPDGDFDSTEPADSATVAAIAPQAVERETTRINLLMGHRKISFGQRRGLDALDGVQDVQTGWEVQGTVGLSVPLLSRSPAEAPDDMYSAAHVFFGTTPGAWVFNGAARLEARYLFEQGQGQVGWRDILAEFDVYTYWRPPSRWNQTFFARLVAAAGWSMNMPFQLTLGGEDMLRGFSEEDHPGGQRLVLNLEDRIQLQTPLDDLFDLGVTIFADLGMAWAGDAPFGENSGLQSNLGAGLRMGFPPSSRQTVRLDLAWPLGPSAGLDNVIFRISANEVLGLLNGIEDRQLRRSRRSGVSAGLFDSSVR